MFIRLANYVTLNLILSIAKQSLEPDSLDRILHSIPHLGH